MAAAEGDESATAAERSVGRQIDAARTAMAAVEGYDQEAVDDLARAVAWAVLEEENREAIADCHARETGLGTETGTHRKLEGLVRGGLADCLGEPSVGRIDTDRPGVVEVAKPVGVIGALVPSTNPASTAAFLAMMAVKGRNAIVVSPSPAAIETCERTVGFIREELAAIGAPPDLVQLLDRPVSRSRAHDLLERADFAHVTGSARNVEAGETSGTPNHCVGAGNATALVDETADVAAAAAAIARGVTFDNGAVCTSESNVVADRRVADALFDRLRAQGGYVCSPEESAAVVDALFEDGHRRRALLADSAPAIADAAGIDAGTPRFLVLRGGETVRPGPASEKLAPVVTVYVDEGFDGLLTRADRVLDVDGAGHSCVLHTDREDRVERFARAVDVCRAVVNQPGALGLPGYGNGLDATLCLGAGVWGGNQLDENLTYRHFLTTTRVARPGGAELPDDAALFEGYDRARPE
jgi:sulfoacetaldehyde dehydrogenase